MDKTKAPCSTEQGAVFSEALTALEKTAQKRGTKDILPIREIGAYCREHNVKLGIITVGQGSAQDVCDNLVKSGIKAIWNFAPVSLKVPNGVLLKQENLALSLAYLNNQISKSF